MLPIFKKWLFNNKPILSFIKANSKLCLLLAFIIVLKPSKAQLNLIVDPSFEIHDSCIANMVLLGTKNWHALDSTNNTYQTTSSCSPAYFNICSIYTDNSLPENTWTGQNYQYPRTGDGMYAMEFFLLSSVNPVYNRDYLRGRIRGGLINGQQYCGKFYVNLFNTQYYGIDRFGAVLDNGALDANNECLPIVATPTWENPAFNYITDTLGWQRVQGAFTANGTETYITIGNFYSHANTNKIIFNAASTRYGEAYYYIDDVSIIPIQIKALAGRDTSICIGDSINLGRPNEVGLDCNWFVAGNATPFANTSNIWYKPTATGTVSLVQSMDNCMMSYDTVSIVVCNNTGIKDLKNEIIDLKIYPNPNNGLFEVNILNQEFFRQNNNVEIKINNTLGQNVQTISVKTLTTLIDLKEDDNGIYFLQLYKNGKHLGTKKIVLQK